MMNDVKEMTARAQTNAVLPWKPSDQPVLIFGGPYSNLAALQAIKAAAIQHQVPDDRVICTGDIVAYCGEPSETTEFIREWGIPVVMGNCEESLADSAADCGCGFEDNTHCSLLSVQWFRFADQRVSSEQRTWMKQLPHRLQLSLAGFNILLVHGAVDSINRFIFASTPDDLKYQQFQQAEAATGFSPDIIVGGHCGIPFASELTSEKGKPRYWLNAGVIGMPANDGTAEGWYMLLHPEHSTGTIRVSFHRLAYDVESTRQVMADRNLVSPYQIALATGLWPSTDILPEDEKQKTGQRLSLGEWLIPSS